MWRRSRQPDVRHSYTRARHRLGRLPGVEVLDWCDQAGSSMARYLSDYRRNADPDALAEAQFCAHALLAAVDLLAERRG